MKNIVPLQVYYYVVATILMVKINKAICFQFHHMHCARGVSQIRRLQQFSCLANDTLSHHQKNDVCILIPCKTEFQQVSYDISEKLGIPLCSACDDNSSFVGGKAQDKFAHCLHIVPYDFQSLESFAVSIQPMNDPTRRSKRKNSMPSRMQPFFIDFCPPTKSKLGQRLGNQTLQKGGESLLKAVAPMKLGNNGNGANIFDFNTGFGQDSIVMAMGGASRVYMIERDPIVGLLLADAMRRLELISHLDEEDDCIDRSKNDVISNAKILSAKLELHQCDSVEFSKSIRMQHSSDFDHDELIPNIPLPDVCYLDPMFPPRTKSSAVKKNMQILHGLFQNKAVDDDNRIEEERYLLNEALMVARKRVVVKRPVTALPLGMNDEKGNGIKGITKPSYELKGSINRFDVYVVDNNKAQQWI